MTITDLLENNSFSSRSNVHNNLYLSCSGLILRRLRYSCFSLIIGCLLYLLFRNNILGFQILGIQTSTINNHKLIAHYSTIYYFIAYCLGDGLWYLSLLLIQIEIGQKNIQVSRFLLYISILLPFIWELLQLVDIVRGTFDIMDILTYLFVILLLWKKDEKFRSLLLRD